MEDYEILKLQTEIIKATHLKLDRVFFLEQVIEREEKDCESKIKQLEDEIKKINDRKYGGKYFTG